ncbi:MAG: hypothetical protein QOG30_339 [Acidimicrobiaceae bacterium]
MIDDDDPGWPLSPRMLLFMVPVIGIFYRRRLPGFGTDGLVLLRQLFLTFCTALVSFGVVLALIYPSEKPPPDAPTAIVAALLVLGGIGVLVSPRIEPPLNCTNDASLTAAYRSRFFLPMAL